MNRLLGIDLNGLWDFAAEGGVGDETKLIDLGIHGSFVRLDAKDHTRWIGGKQAALAPHGKGAGWGQIGAQKRRLFVRDILVSLANGKLNAAHESAFRSFLEEWTRDARFAVFAVPDVPSFDEAARDRYLQLLTQSMRLRPTLLWRPIAAVLGWLEGAATGVAGVTSGSADSLQVAVLSLMSSGVQLSDARLVRETWRGGDFWVPERDKAGVEGAEAYAGEALAFEAAESIAAQLNVESEVVLAAANAPWRFCVGAAPDFELLRMANRSWRKLPPNAPPACVEIADLPKDWTSRVAQADWLLVEGPMAENEGWVRAAIRAAGLSDERKVCRAPSGLVAEGCLAAARRAQAGMPIYYDFLPQLEINALVGGEPSFVELIPQGTRLAGGRRYRGHAPGEFAISKGATRLTFYLFKEDLPRGRKAEVYLPEESKSTHRIRVAVEQSPGQGFAQISIDSGTFEALRRHPVELNWSRMEVIEESKAEILATLSGSAGLAYPDINIAPGHPILWHPRHREGDLVEQLRSYADAPIVLDGAVDERGWNALRTLRRRFSRADNPSLIARRMGLRSDDRTSCRALDGNGAIPSTRGPIAVPSEAEDLLERALAKAEIEFNQVLALNRLPENTSKELIGDLIGFASWCFWRCPGSVTNFLLDVYDEQRQFPVQFILLQEGVGRAVHTRHHLERYFNTVGAKLSSGRALTSMEFSAIGRVLGGVEEAADCLQPRTADRILQQTCNQLAEENQQRKSHAYKKKFKNALRMLAALLRHRRVRPIFLDPDSSAAAVALLSVLDFAMNRNARFGGSSGDPTAARRFSINAAILGELVGLIQKEGTDPNIIRKIEEIEE